MIKDGTLVSFIYKGAINIFSCQNDKFGEKPKARIDLCDDNESLLLEIKTKNFIRNIILFNEQEFDNKIIDGMSDLVEIWNSIDMKSENYEIELI